MRFVFGGYGTEVRVSREIPRVEQIAAGLGLSELDFPRFLVVADENTSAIAGAVCGSVRLPCCVLKSGEASKSWEGVQKILSAAHEAGIGRDGVFIGIGGGVIGDLSGFAASIYMRGSRLVLVATTLLAMADASVGGKTGFDLFGIRNLVGSFYPAETAYMPLGCLESLPSAGWKSGMAELIKTAVLDGEDFLDELAAIAASFPPGAFDSGFPLDFAGKMLEGEVLCRCVNRAAGFKGRIVQEDPRETGSLRMILNLGHTFGHALEASAGPGKISHGEAVAWGIVRSVELGRALGITPRPRAEKITKLIDSFGYCHTSPHPLVQDADRFLAAMRSDKKKRSGKLAFIVPDEKSARPVLIESSALAGAIGAIVQPT